MADSIPVGVPVASVGVPNTPIGRPESGSALTQTVKPTAVATTVVASATTDATKTVETPEQQQAALKAAKESFEHQKRVEEIKLKRLAEKNKADREAERKTWGEKLSAAEKFEKMKAQAKLNPLPYLKELLGDNYYDKIVEMKIGGNAPTADTLAVELEQMEARLEKKYADREAERVKSEEAARKQQAEQADRQAQQEVNLIASEFWEKNGKEYPALRGTPEFIAATIAREIQDHFNRTFKIDEETGAILKQGEILTAKEVADRWEANVLSHAVEVSKLPKYAEKLKSPAAETGSQSAGQKVSRTLTNDLTGTTPAPKTKAASDEERRERANAAFLNVMSRKKV